MLDSPNPLATDRLRQSFLFQGWPERDVIAIARHASVCVRKRGDELFVQDDECVMLHVLTRGKVWIYRRQPDGHDVAINTVCAAGLIACAALFTDGVYPACARVESTDAELVVVQGEPFLALLDARPDLSRRMIAALASRLTELTGRLESQAVDTALVRVTKWLLDAPRKPGPPMHVLIPGTKRSTAFALGMVPETFSRCLRKLEAEGLINVCEHAIDIIDIRSLIAKADG